LEENAKQEELKGGKERGTLKRKGGKENEANTPPCVSRKAIKKNREKRKTLKGVPGGKTQRMGGQ